MKTRKFICLTICVLLISISTAIGQDKKPLFIGIQPISITIEPFYDKGEFDINVFPMVVEFSIRNRTNLRFTPTVNYHSGGVTDGFSDLGVFTVVPIYFNKKELKEAKSHGFYIGPVLGIGRNNLNNHYTTTVAFEPGYTFEAKKRFAIIIGCQFGGSFFAYDSTPNKWTSHFGPKVVLGLWLGSNNATD